MATSRMPAVFVGDGNPVNALARNARTEGWARLAASMPRPVAIVKRSRRTSGDEPISFPVEGVDGGSVSMLCVPVG